jgi:hypothetical protein
MEEIRLTIARMIMPQNSMTNAFAGAAAGLAATIPMTGVIALCQSSLPLADQLNAPPPHQVAMDVAEALSLKPHLELDERLILTLLSHFGYGAAAGTVYGLATSDNAPAPALRGVGFGCLVWAGSYLGWLPAAGFRAAAHRMSLRRNLMMLGAHVVWGAALGTLFARRRGTSRSEADQREGGSSGETSKPLTAGSTGV